MHPLEGMVEYSTSTSTRAFHETMALQCMCLHSKPLILKVFLARNEIHKNHNLDSRQDSPRLKACCSQSYPQAIAYPPGLANAEVR